MSWIGWVVSLILAGYVFYHLRFKNIDVFRKVFRKYRQDKEREQEKIVEYRGFVNDLERYGDEE